MGIFRKDKVAERKTGAAGASGFGAPLHLAFSQHPLPQGGAMSFSFDTLALPRTTPIGNGVANKDTFRSTIVQAGYMQGITLQSLGAPGIPTGNIVTQPLLDTQNTGIGQDVILPSFAMPGAYEIPRGHRA